MSDLPALVDMMSAAGAERTYVLNAVPPKPAYPYAVLGLDTGTPGQRRAGGGATRKPRMLTVQLFGRTLDGVLDYAGHADAAFEDKVLDLPGTPFATRDIQTSPYRDPDDSGVLNILHTYKLQES